jgi:hypothetical protein
VTIAIPKFGDAPVWRLIGSVGAWLLFGYCFTLFLISLLQVVAIGGTCATGGPYVIAVQCPEDNAFFSLLGVYGSLAAVLVFGVFLARDFGTRIVALAWPILFLILGGLFLVGGGAAIAAGGTHAAADGGIAFLLIGVLFVVMALVPVVLEVHAGGWQRQFLGARRLDGVRFLEKEDATKSWTSPGQPNPPGAVAPTARDWGLSLGIFVCAGGLGILLALATAGLL